MTRGNSLHSSTVIYYKTVNMTVLSNNEYNTRMTVQATYIVQSTTHAWTKHAGRQICSISI